VRAAFRQDARRRKTKNEALVQRP